MRAWVLAGLALATGMVGLARAADTGIPLTADTIILTRQSGMDLQGGVTDAMKAAVAAGADVKPYADGAKALSSWIKVYVQLFPDGTQHGENTKAKAEIWTNRAEFEKDATNLATQADKLAELAKAGDKDGFAAQFKQVGAACGACHRQFKERS